MARPALRRSWVELGAAALAAGYAVVALWAWGLPLMSPDAIDYSVVARNLVWGKGYRTDILASHPSFLPSVRHLPEWHGLLRSFELVPFFGLLGVSDDYVKLPSVLYAGGLCWLVFVLARQLWGAIAGYAAILLVAGSRELGLVTALGADDVGSAFWTLLTFYGACRAVERPSARAMLLVGLAAGMGTLEKFTGVILPYAIAFAVLLLPSTRRSVGVFRAAILVVPATLAACAYFYRNYLLYGSADFRFSALEWLGKAGNMAAYFAYYPVRPTTGSVWSNLGVAGVLGGIMLEVRALLDMVWENFVVMVGGLAALIHLVRRAPLFAGSSLVYGTGLVLSIVVGHQFEPRYVLSLVCLDAVALAAAGAELGGKLLARFDGPARTKSALATAAVMVVLTALSARMILDVRAQLLRFAPQPGCAAARAFVRDRVPIDAPVLTGDPWYVAWRLFRPAVMAPTNGTEAVAAVARHYGIAWAVVGPRVYGSVDLGVELGRLGASNRGFAPRVVGGSDDCRVYSLY